MPIINTIITETTNITENGQYDVAKYTTANVDVQPVLEELEITPSTSSQTFTSTTDGYSSVSVDAVDSSIDNNIIPENIKKDITILGVTGTHEGGGGPERYVALVNDGNGVLVHDSSATQIVDLTDITVIGDSTLVQAYMNTTGITNVDMSSITSINSRGMVLAFYQSQIKSIDLSSLDVIYPYGLDSAFYNSTLQSADFSSLRVIGEYAMSNAFTYSNIISIDMSSVTTVEEHGLTHAFQDTPLTTLKLGVRYLGLTNGSTPGSALESICENCTNLTSVEMKNLGQIDTQITSAGAFYYAFAGCSSLTRLDFPALWGLGAYSFGYMIVGNSNMNIYFPSLNTRSFINNQGSVNKNCLRNSCMLAENITLHFPSNIQSNVESQNTYATGFGGTNTTILFDLDPAYILQLSDGNEYYRNASLDSTSSCYISHFNGEKVYMNKIPEVGDTVYSDIACSTSYATINAIV